MYKFFYVISDEYIQQYVISYCIFCLQLHYPPPLIYQVTTTANTLQNVHFERNKVSSDLGGDSHKVTLKNQFP
jgi:hypothetical protein